MEDYQHGTKIVVLRCNHNFDADCVAIWLTKHVTCPICKLSVK